MPERLNFKPIAITQSVPNWLTKDFFTERLRIYFNEPSLEVVCLNACPAVGKGENFGGILNRVSVQYTIDSDRELRTGSYIVKSSFEKNDFLDELMKDYDLYTKEINIYEKIIPKLNALLEEIGDSDKISPQTISVDYDLSAIVFEDLLESQYKVCDRTIGLDMHQAKLCLRKLAKMHATSAVLNEREPGIFKKYDRGMFNRHTNGTSQIYLGTLEACSKMVSQWDDYKDYAAKLLALKPKLMEYGKQVFDPIEGHINVLTHGDIWVNNAMFQDGPNQQPNDAILIDFQYSCWGSPAIDLHYLFNTSLREEIRLHRQDELIQYYYNIFTGTLRTLRYQAKIPSLHQFRLHMDEKSFYAFISGCLIQPIMLNEETEDADLQTLMGEDERAVNFKNTIYKNQRVQQNLRRLLPIFDRKGLLDHRD